MSHFQVIKASAGSGKTFTLVKQYLSLAFSYPHSYGYQKILAITFTNKAATEMKERVIHYLRGLSEGVGSDFYDSAMAEAIAETVSISLDDLQMRSKDVLTHMIHHYNDIAISTIDTFVHRLIRSFAKDLNLNLDFEVEMDTDLHLTQALENVMLTLGTDEALTKYVMRFVEHQMEEKGKWQISKELKGFAAKNLFDEKGAFGINQLADVAIPSFSNIIKTIGKRVKERDSAAKQMAQDCLNLVAKNGLDESVPHTHKFNFIKNVAKAGLIELNGSAKTFLEEGIWTKKTTKEPTLSEHESLSKPTAEGLQKLYADLAEHLALKALYKELYATALLKRINDELTRIKKDNNLLFISDFNSKISEVIQHEPAPFIYERIGERFNHILIDEFQDTSTLQWNNLLPLIENGLAKNKSSLIVGDGKQSIYRFRNGDVEQFAMLPQLKNPKNELLISQRASLLERQFNPDHLAFNYRSSHHIINFNNWFIEKTKNQLDLSLTSIYDQHEQGFVKEKPGFVRVKVLDRKEDKAGIEVLTDLTAQIKSLKDAGHKLNDMAILVRKNAEANIIAGHLMEEQIPVISQGSLSYRDSKKVNLVINTLLFLLHPSHRFTAETLALHFCEYNKFDITAFMLKAFPSKKEMLLVEVMNLQLQQPLPTQITGLSLYEMVEQLIVSFGFNKSVDPFIAGLLDFAHGYQLKFGANFQGFIEWMHDKGFNKAITMPENIDAVQLLTIHSSKGLQFPTVFIPNLKSSAPLSDQYHWVDTREIIPALPVACIKQQKGLMESTFGDVISEEINKTELDVFNLLYVAVTRPESNLFIWTANAPSKTTFDFYLQAVTQHGSWDPATESLTLGASFINEKKHASDPTYVLRNFTHSQWNKLENISFSAPDNWEFHSLFEKTEIGNMYHEILAHVHVKEDIGRAIDKMKVKLDLTPELIDEIHLNLTSLLDLPQLQPWFSPEVKAMNETPILLANGQILRPDRVVFLPSETIVIDYKTGHFTPNYLKQLNHYAHALTDLGYKNIKKYLIFLESKEITAYD